MAAEARETEHARRSEEMGQQAVALKEEVRRLKDELSKVLDKHSEMEAVVGASCADLVVLTQQLEEAMSKHDTAESRVRELEEHKRSTSKNMLALQLAVDAKDAQGARLEKELVSCQVQMKDLTSERNDLAREVDALKAEAFKQHMQLADATNSLRVSQEDKLARQRQHDATNANQKEAIENLREQVAAMQREVIEAKDELDKATGLNVLGEAGLMGMATDMLAHQSLARAPCWEAPPSLDEALPTSYFLLLLTSYSAAISR